MTYWYTAFGLIIRSELQIPELQVVSEQSYDVDIVFTYFEHGLDLAKTWYSLHIDRLVFVIDGVARYRVLRGTRIEIASYDSIDEDEIRLFLLGSAMGGLLHQRGVFPLHASAVEIDGKAVLFSADSGFGKSTICKSFYEKGYRVITDDIAMLRVDEYGKVVVEPGYPQLKLWKDTLIHFADDVVGLKRIRKQDEKFGFKLKERFTKESVPLGKVYFLAKTGDRVTLEELTGMAKITALQKNTFRSCFLTKEQQIINFKKAGKIGDKTQFFVLKRPENGFYTDEIIKIVLQQNHGK